MTMIGFDGFETYGDLTTTEASIEANIEATDDKRWTTITGDLPGTTAIVADFLGEGFALEIDDTGASSGRGEFVSFAFGSAYNELTSSSVKEYVFGFRYYNGELDSASTIPSRVIWYNTVGTYSATPSHSRHSTLSVLSNSTTLRWVSSGGAVTVDAVAALTANTWHYIELHYKPTTAAQGGYMKVYVDGNLVIDDATGNVVSATFFRNLGVQLGALSSGGNNDGGNSTAARFDDCYWLEDDGVTHTGPLGSVRAVLLPPNSDGATNDWTPSTGADNFALIDEQDWDTSDYVDGTSPDDDHYGLTTLTNATTVHGMRIDVVCQATSGTPTLNMGFDNGTADETNKGVIGTGSVVQKSDCYPLDPSGAAWTVSSVNSVEATQRVT